MWKGSTHLPRISPAPADAAYVLVTDIGRLAPAGVWLHQRVGRICTGLSAVPKNQAARP